MSGDGSPIVVHRNVLDIDLVLMSVHFVIKETQSSPSASESGHSA